MRLAATAPTPAGRPVVLVVPHAGWSYSGLAAARRVPPPEARRLRARRGPRSLAPGLLRGYALDDATAYRTPIGDVPLCDGALAALLGGEARVVGA